MFLSVLLCFVCHFSSISLQHQSAFELLKDFRCEVSSEDVKKTITITEWTKTYDAMISTATCFHDKFNGEYIDL